MDRYYGHLILVLAKIHESHESKCFSARSVVYVYQNKRWIMITGGVLPLLD